MMAFRIHDWVDATWGWSVPIPAYFPLLGIGFVVGVYVIVGEARRLGIDANHVLNLFIYATVGIFLGARLFVVLPRLDHYLANSGEMFRITEAGLASHGGFLGGLAVLVAYAAWQRLPLLRLADTLPGGFAVGLFFARIGCFLEGSCYGRITALPWGVRFPAGSVAYGDASRAGLAGGAPTLTQPLHPTQLLAAAAAVCLFALALSLARRRRFDGEVFFGGMLFYGCTRLAIDALRGDLGGESLFFGVLPTTQFVNALVGLAAALGLGYLSWRFKRTERVAQLA
jgi:phosphatidylglycerol---prolipoprotein diacylglyceryl transferase